MDARRLSQESACARVVTRKKAKHRTIKDPAIRESQLDDRLARRNKDNTLNKFREMATAITPAPGVNSSNWRMVNNLLIEADEEKDRQQTNMTIHISHGDLDTVKAVMYRLMKSELFRDVLQQVVNEEDLSPQLLDGPLIKGGRGPNHRYKAEFQAHSLIQTNTSASAPAASDADDTDNSPEPMPALPPTESLEDANIVEETTVSMEALFDGL